MPILGLGLITGGVLLFLILPTLGDKNPQKVYEAAQHKCGNELWLMVSDFDVYDVKVKAPYPQSVSSVVGERVIDYECSEAGAQQYERDSAQWGWLIIPILMSPTLFVASGAIVIIIWLTKRLRHKTADKT